MIRIAIADDHPLIREGCKRIMEKASDIELLGEANSTEGVWNLLAEGECDILLLDINLPGENGLAVLPALKERYPGMKVLVLSMYPENVYAARSIRRGADGYIAKKSVADELLSAIYEVFNTGHYIKQDILDRLVDQRIDGRYLGNLDSLTEREFQVFSMIGSGKSVKEISFTLDLSISTVHTYRHRLLTKLGLCSDKDIVRLAIESGIGS